MARYATGKAAKLKPWCLWVRLPPVLLEQHASAGHWRAQVAVTHPPSGCAGSTPARRTDNMARSSSGRMRDPHSRGTGSIPVRVTDTAKWRNWYTRDAQNVVSLRACEFDSRLGYLIAGAAGAQPVCPNFHKAGGPARYRDLQLDAGGPVLIRAS
jgi:hypothetical protein